MAGTVHMIQDVKLPDTGSITTNRRNWYLALFKMFTLMEANNGYVTRVGLFGDETWGWHDQGNPVGDGGWSLWRMNAANVGSLRTKDYYIALMDMAGGAANQLPQYGNSNGQGPGFAIGQREDGGVPWGGALANAGGDAKSDPVWADGGSRVHVLPRSNNDFSGTSAALVGGRSVNADAGALYTSTSFNYSVRYHLCMDADSFFLAAESNDSGEYEGSALIGRLNPIAGITYGAIDPLFMAVNKQSSSAARPSNQLYGTLAHNDTNEEGGVFLPNVLNGPAGVYHEALVGKRADSGMSPDENLDLAPQATIGHTIDLFSEETAQGELGIADPDFMRTAIFPNEALTTVNSIQRCAFGHTTSPTIARHLVAWPSANPPKTSNTRDGVYT